jgi:hypothetical protein
MRREGIWRGIERLEIKGLQGERRGFGKGRSLERKMSRDFAG